VCPAPKGSVDLLTLCVYTYLCMCLPVYVCVCMYVCMYVCVCVCVRVWGLQRAAAAASRPQRAAPSVATRTVVSPALPALPKQTDWREQEERL
jgi:hypothetical protein